MTFEQNVSAIHTAIENKDAEIGRLQALVSVLTEAVVIADSYGVEGSSFHTCLACGAGGAPGIPFKHSDLCAVGRAEETAERWFREQKEEIEEYETEGARLREALKTLLDRANAIVGASPSDPQASEAFHMFDDARVMARAALRNQAV